MISAVLDYTTLNKMVTFFYRAMHYSAKRVIEIAYRLSVCLSVPL